MRGPLTVDITPEVVSLAKVVAEEVQRAIGLDEPWSSLHAYLDGPTRLAQIAAAERTLGLDLRSRRILEIGSGMGMLITLGRKIGLDIVGCEPAANAYAHLGAARAALLQTNGIPIQSVITCAGEQLPWANATFDVVLSYQVLEHVAAPSAMLAEAMRVLKPGGRLYCEAPSHFSFIEGHFGIAWLPPLAASQRVAKAFVAMQGRNSSFLDELNLVTPARVRRWIAPIASAWAVTCRPRLEGPSPSTEGIQVTCRGPSMPEGRRFRGVAATVRRATRHRWVRPWLERLELSDQVVLTATK